MKTLSVLVEIESSTHQNLHVLQDSRRTGRDMVPGALQAMNRSCSECGDNRRECRKVVDLTAFLSKHV